MASIRLALIFSAAALIASAAAADPGAKPVVEARIAGMKALSDATKALGAAKLGVVPYSPGLIRRVAAEIRLHGTAAQALYPLGSLTPESGALPLIGAERPRFDHLLEEMLRAADRLNAAADERPAAFAAGAALAETCKACHAVFRRKKP